jgi:hypothetical protein
MELRSNKTKDNRVKALKAQLAENDQQIQAITARARENEQQIQKLKMEVAKNQQLEQALRAQLASLDSQLREITNSKVWQLGLLLRRIRVGMAPIGSRREILLRKIWSGIRILRSQGVVAFLRHSLARMFGKTNIDGRLNNIQRPPIESIQRYQSIPGMTDSFRQRAKRIEQSDLFDFEWYSNDNPEVIERGLDPVEHYLIYGIRQEKNPNPLFNTSIYAKWAGVQKEDALLHFKDSGYLYAPGAYRNAEILMTAQRRYQDNLSMECVIDKRSAKRKYAVYLQCGSGSIHDKWLTNSAWDWDLIVDHYDQTYLNRISCNVEFSQTGVYPGTKFTSFNQLLINWPNLIDSYMYILLLDDDIFITEEDISKLFNIIDEESLELAQASLSTDSHFAHPVFANPGKKGIRYVNGVEIMMPVISQSIMRSGSHMFGQSISGWGIDVALSKLACAEHKVAVIDDIVARHVKPINVEGGAFYEMLHRACIYPEIELTHLQKIYGVTRSFYQIALPKRKAKGNSYGSKS